MLSNSTLHKIRDSNAAFGDIASSIEANKIALNASLAMFEQNFAKQIRSNATPINAKSLALSSNASNWEGVNAGSGYSVLQLQSFAAKVADSPKYKGGWFSAPDQLQAANANVQLSKMALFNAGKNVQDAMLKIYGLRYIEQSLNTMQVEVIEDAIQNTQKALDFASSTLNTTARATTGKLQEFAQVKQSNPQGYNAFMQSLQVMQSIEQKIGDILQDAKAGQQEIRSKIIKKDAEKGLSVVGSNKQHKQHKQQKSSPTGQGQNGTAKIISFAEASRNKASKQDSGQDNGREV